MSRIDSLRVEAFPEGAFVGCQSADVGANEERIKQALIKLGWTPPSTGHPIPVAELKVETQMVNPPNPICYHVRVNGKSVALLLQGEVAQAVDKFNALLEKRRRSFVDKVPSIDTEDYRNDPRN